MLVVVPALVSTVQSLTGAVDDERAAAQSTAETLAGDLSRNGVQARGLVGADDTVLAIEDALREFGADEIVLAGADDRWSSGPVSALRSPSRRCSGRDGLARAARDSARAAR